MKAGIFSSAGGRNSRALGGTLLQLIVPAALAVSFAVRQELPGTAFCAFAFFHSLTGVATYMADALRLELPLVTVGAAPTKRSMTG
ncbi:MAG TPA: hypothetical protein VGJ33_06460 [Candidatus Angelobacter sp.]|jgi:hypothetical protein